MEGTVTVLLDPEQNNTAKGIGKGGVGLPNAMRKAAKRTLGLNAIILTVTLYTGNTDHVIPPFPHFHFIIAQPTAPVNRSCVFAPLILRIFFNFA